MGIIQRTLNRFGFYDEKQFKANVEEAVKREIDKMHDWLASTAEGEYYNQPDPLVFATQADLYRLSPILGTAVDILSNDVGTSKFNVKRRRGEEMRDIPNHEFELLLRNPNPLDSGMEHMQYTVSNRLLNGNAIWWLNRESEKSKPDEMWAIPYSFVQPVPDKFMYISHWKYFAPNGREERLETWEIVHFKNYNPNSRYWGISPLESLAVTIRGDLAMRLTNTRNYAEYGGSPQSILAFKDFPSDKAWSEIKEEKRQAAKRNEMMMLRGVGDGVTWLQRALSNKDMDYIQGLRQNMTDVFNRLAPGLLAMLDPSATEANAMAARATYGEKTLFPMGEGIAQKITSDILPAYGLNLVGMFDDPRVVDRKLKLEEQTAYERSHTLKEVRKEFYEDDPLGDERDNMIAAHVGAKPVQEEQPKEQNGEESPQVEDTSEMQPDVTAKAEIEELDKWKRKALKRVGKDTPFDTNVLGAKVQEYVNSRLPKCRSETAVKAVFDNARDMLAPAKSAADVLEAIRLGVMALEKK